MKKVSENLFKLDVPRFWGPTKNDHSKFEAKKVGDIAYVAAKKIDGNQGRFTKQDGIVGILSRTLKTVNRKKTDEYVDNYDKLPQFHTLINSLPEGTQLMVELHQFGKDSAEVGSILRCLPEKAITRQNGEFGFVRAYLCDVVAYDNEYWADQPFEKRMEKVREIWTKHFAENEYSDLIELVYDDVVATCFSWIAEGYEGGILYRKGAPISLGGKKSWDTIKIKGSGFGVELDFVITSVKSATKEYKGKTDLSLWKFFDGGEPVTKYWSLGMHGSIGIGGYDEDGNLIEIGTVNSGLTDEIRLLPEAELVGKVAFISSFSKNIKDRTLREPVFHKFHAEKNPE